MSPTPAEDLRRLDGLKTMIDVVNVFAADAENELGTLDAGPIGEIVWRHPTTGRMLMVRIGRKEE